MLNYGLTCCIFYFLSGLGVFWYKEEEVGAFWKEKEGMWVLFKRNRGCGHFEKKKSSGCQVVWEHSRLGVSESNLRSWGYLCSFSSQTSPCVQIWKKKYWNMWLHLNSPQKLYPTIQRAQQLKRVAWSYPSTSAWSYSW